MRAGGSCGCTIVFGDACSSRGLHVPPALGFCSPLAKGRPSSRLLMGSLERSRERSQAGQQQGRCRSRRVGAGAGVAKVGTGSGSGSGSGVAGAGQVVSVKQVPTATQRTLSQLKAKTSRGQSVACSFFAFALLLSGGKRWAQGNWLARAIMRTDGTDARSHQPVASTSSWVHDHGRPGSIGVEAARQSVSEMHADLTAILSEQVASNGHASTGVLHAR